MWESIGRVVLSMKFMNLDTWMESMRDAQYQCDEFMLYVLSRVHCHHSIVYTLKWSWTTIDSDTPIKEDEIHSAYDIQLVYLGGQIYSKLKLLPITVAPRIMVHAMEVTLPVKSRRGQCKPLDLSVPLSSSEANMSNTGIVVDCVEELNKSHDGMMDITSEISSNPHLAASTSVSMEPDAGQVPTSFTTEKTSRSTACCSNTSGPYPENMDLSVDNEQTLMDIGLDVSTKQGNVSTDKDNMDVTAVIPTVQDDVVMVGNVAGNISTRQDDVSTRKDSINDIAVVATESMDGYVPAENVTSKLNTSITVSNLHKLSTEALKRAFPKHNPFQVAKIYTDHDQIALSQSTSSRKLSRLTELCTHVLSTLYPGADLEELIKAQKPTGFKQVMSSVGIVNINFEEYLKKLALKRVSVTVSKLDPDIIKLWTKTHTFNWRRSTVPQALVIALRRSVSMKCPSMLEAMYLGTEDADTALREKGIPVLAVSSTEICVRIPQEKR